MSANRLAFAAALCAATLFTTFGADARPVRWARSGDALTLDPHAQNEGPTHALNHHIYEPLVIRDQKGAIVPALATSWKVLESDKTVWEFKIRQGSNSTTATPSTPTTWCSRSSGPWRPRPT